MVDRAPTLLVIEDAQDQAILVGVAARNALPGLEVRIAGNGQEGIDFLAATALVGEDAPNPVPDLVILDLLMPVVDGFGVLEWIRDELGEPPFPVVVLTATSNPEHEARARELGAADVHEKPVSLESLDSEVRTIVTRWIQPGDILAAHIASLG